MHKKIEKADLVISNCKQLLTCKKDSKDLIGLMENGWIAITGDKISAIGTEEEVKREVDCSEANFIDAHEKVVAPGFIDCHTHVVFGGSRVEEYTAKLTIDDVSEIEKLGIETGIMVSVNMTRKASIEKLYIDAAKRLKNMLYSGTTTVESKSGYGLSTSDEIKMLKVNEQLSGNLDIDIVSTFLGAHGWPRDISKDKYLDILTKEMLPWVAELGLATASDIWCDHGYYTAKESERVLKASRDMGLEAKIHTDAYSYIGGSDLAADMKMLSADHLNYTPREVMRKLANAGVPGVIMPALDFAVNHPKPFNPRMMVEEGMELALATNCCPGCWTESMQFVMMMGCRNHRITPEEAIRAATLGGAKALGLESDRGSLEVGKLADIQIWDVSTYKDIVYHLGGNVVEKVIKKGKLVVDLVQKEG